MGAVAEKDGAVAGMEADENRAPDQSLTPRTLSQYNKKIGYRITEILWQAAEYLLRNHLILLQI